MRSTPVALLLGVLTGCVAREDEPPPTAVIAGEWRAQAVEMALEDSLRLDEDGNGDATLFRWTSALFQGNYAVTATEVTSEHDDGVLHFALDFECPPDLEAALCDQRWLFTSDCQLDDDELRCFAPSWYHEDVIRFTPADATQ